MNVQPLLAALLAVLQSLASSGPGPAPIHDCNSNGVDDAADIALGTSADENENGVPDECEPAGRRAFGDGAAPRVGA